MCGFLTGTLVQHGEGTEQLSSPVFLDKLVCNGDETSLLQCNTFSQAHGIHSCSSASNNVRITCLGDLKLFYACMQTQL